MFIFVFQFSQVRKQRKNQNYISIWCFYKAVLIIFGIPAKSWEFCRNFLGILAETSGKIHSLSGEFWPPVDFMEELQPKSHNSAMEGQPTQLCTKPETGLLQNGSRCFGLMRQNLEIFGCSRIQFSEKLESNTIMSICGPQWSMFFFASSQPHLCKWCWGQEGGQD